MIRSVAAASAISLGLLLLLARGRRQWQRRRRKEQQPPSVGRYPLVGSLYHLPEPWYSSLYELYGSQPVVTVYMGMQKVYVLNSWESFKEAMIDNSVQLSGRMELVVRDLVFKDSGGVSNIDGVLWQEYRRFTMRALRQLGMGQRRLEEMIAEEADHLWQTVEAADGAPLETLELLSVAPSNVICQLVFGSRMASEDAKFAEILEMFQLITRNSKTRQNECIFMSLAPLIKRLQFLFPLFEISAASKLAVANFQKLVGYCEQQRLLHVAEIETVYKARDYIDAHLIHQKTRPEIFNDTRLSLAVADLFIAGTDTTANTLRWAILFMIDNPDVAEKTHQEIVDAIGRDRLPEMKDRQRLAYTQAVIEEVLRRSSLVPLGLFHRVTDKVTVGGFELEKDDICAFNVYGIHHDARHFPEPNKFLPERHLKDGQFVGCERLAAFGIGKRACLGESLARTQLFVYFATLMQRYRVSLDPEDSRTVWDLTENHQVFSGTLLRAPPTHKVVFTRR